MGKQFSLKIKKLITNQIKSFVMIKQRRYKVLIPYQNVEGNYEFGNLLLLKHLPTARKIGSRTHAYMKEAMVRHSLVVYFPSSTIGPLPQREKEKNTNKSNAEKQKPLPCYALWIEALPFCSSAA